MEQCVDHEVQSGCALLRLRLRFKIRVSLVEAVLMAPASELFVALFLVLLQSSTNVLAVENCLPSDGSFCRCSTRNITLDITQIGLSYP